MSLDSQEKTLIDYATEGWCFLVIDRDFLIDFSLGNYAEVERILKEKKEAVDVQDEVK